jgi:hypothetical protein
MSNGEERTPTMNDTTTTSRCALAACSALPIFRRKGAYSMDCYDTKLSKLVLFYPFIPRRNSKAPEYMSFRREADGSIRHFRFERVGDQPRSLIYRQVRCRPNTPDHPRRDT